MLEDKRKSPRIPIGARVRVVHSSLGEIILKAQDISDGGMFILSNGTEFPPVGAEMQVQALDTPVEAALLNVCIVRKLQNGVGVMFCE